MEINLAVLQTGKHLDLCAGTACESHFICLLRLILKLTYLHGLRFCIFTHMDDHDEHVKQQLDN